MHLGHKDARAQLVSRCLQGPCRSMAFHTARDPWVTAAWAGDRLPGQRTRKPCSKDCTSEPLSLESCEDLPKQSIKMSNAHIFTLHSIPGPSQGPNQELHTCYWNSWKLIWKSVICLGSCVQLSQSFENEPAWASASTHIHLRLSF